MRLSQIDYDREMAFAATDAAGDILGALKIGDGIARRGYYAAIFAIDEE